MTHTPGPWNAETFCVWAGDKYVAATQTGIPEEEQQANAKLIAAAPELLEALKAAKQYLAFHSSEGCEPVPLQRVRAAIKAATS